MLIRTAVPADLAGIQRLDHHIEKLGYRLCGGFLPPDQDARELMYRKELVR